MRTLLLIMLVGLVPTAAMAADKTAAADPKAALIRLVINKDDQVAGLAMLALRATGDKDLLPIFEAFARSGEKGKRLFAVSSAAQMFGKDAVGLLSERLEKDPAMTIRAEALVGLLALKSASVDQLKAAVRMDDEAIQCISARALVQKGQADLAAPTLKKLAASKDLATSCMAKMCLLSLGHNQYAKELRTTLLDPKTPEEIQTLMLEQASEEKVAAALPMVQALIDSQPGTMTSTRAYKALSGLSKGASESLVQAILSSQDTILVAHLMQLVAIRDDAKKQLPRLLSAKNAAAPLADFELNRLDPAKSAKVIRNALALEHPIIIDYVLDVLARDVKDHPDKAGAFVAPLLDFIQSVPTDVDEMRSEHFHAALATKIVVDTGTPEAIEGLSEILAGRYDAVVRSAGAGIGKSTNAKAACQLARPLLKRAYVELSTDGALTLARFGDKGAVKPLAEIVARPAHNSTPLLALACWYSLKLQGTSKEAAKEIARQIK